MRYKVAARFKPLLWIIDSLGTILFFWLRWRPQPKIRRILIIRLDHIGDVVLTTPVIKGLRNRFRSADIDILVRPFCKELLENDADISKVISLSPPWFVREKSSKRALYRFVRKNRNRYDLVIELHADPRNILLGRLVGRYVVGSSVRGFGFLLNKVVPYDNVHVIDRMNRAISAVGVKKLYAQPYIALDKKDKDFADGLFKKYGVKNAVCINVGTGRENKYWLNDRWAKVADCLIRRGCTILFTGSISDSKDIQEVIGYMQEKRHVNLAGKTTLRQLAAVIGRCKLFIGPDTGPMHIARAVKTPLIGLFGATDPRIWGYDAPRYRSIAKTGCVFCDKPRCSRSRDCMKKISVEDVLKLASDTINI